MNPGPLFHFERSLKQSLGSFGSSRIPKCILSINLPSTRLASLTGAIQRGARKAKEVGERPPRDGSRTRFETAGNFGKRMVNFGSPGDGFGAHDANSSGDESIRQWQRTGGSSDQRESRHAKWSPNRRPKIYQKTDYSYGRGTHRVPLTEEANTKSSSPTKQEYSNNAGYSKGTGTRRAREGQRAEFASHGERSRRPSPGKPGVRQRRTREREEKDGNDHVESRKPTSAAEGDRVPLSIPRTTAASEFLYGTSAVKAALQAHRRQNYKLYICQGDEDPDSRGSDETIIRLARKKNLTVITMPPGQHQLLDKMAKGRPHNGYVLEASQLPMMPAEALDKVESPAKTFTFTPAHQSAEDMAVNGNSREVVSNSRRYPFVIMLDSIHDTGNLGAIIRSAAFFGVDAIALIDHNLAPFTAVTLKASAGAADSMQYLKVKREHDFVKRSQGNGWKFIAAVAPNSESAGRGGSQPGYLQDAETALLEGPCVLMLGGEGDGLQPRLQKAADAVIGIQGGDNLNRESGLDSLNVSVAAALMTQTFMKGTNARAEGEASEMAAGLSEKTEKVF